VVAHAAYDIQSRNQLKRGNI